MDKPVVVTENEQIQIVVTGAAGRIGRALRALWGDSLEGMPIRWSARRPRQGIDLVWNIGDGPVPDLPSGAIFLHLAGQVGGSKDALAENRRSAAELCSAAQRFTARHVLFMSSAAVYRPGPAPIPEEQPPDPSGDYGRVKLGAEQAARAVMAQRLTVLRLGNLAGADALLSAARCGPVLLDPVGEGGPQRSYIGPGALAAVLRALIVQTENLPPLLNLGLAPALDMADLLRASQADWRFGPPRPAAIARVELCLDRLAGLVDLPAATPDGLVADLLSLRGVWP